MLFSRYVTYCITAFIILTSLAKRWRISLTGVLYILISSYIPRTLELFVESLLTKTLRITNSRNAKTLSTSHMKQCIMSEQRFDFLRELVKNVPDISVAEEAANYNEEDGQSSPDDVYPDSDTPYDLSMPSTSGGRNQYRTVSGQTKINGGQTHFQYKQQQQYQLPPHNGSAINTASTEADLRQRIRQRLNNTQSVIVHTASVAQAAAAAAKPPTASPATATTTPATTPTTARAAYGNYVQPIKLMRSESSPANAAQHLWQVSTNSATQKQTGQKRLRHQALSVPCNNNNDNCTGTSPAKRQKADSITQQTHSQTAIPAPVFSYDLCNKPVVKIDYSNLPLTPATLGTSEQLHTTPSMGNLPLSAPVTNANFNFSAAAPIINIDLSNIVTNSGGDSKLLSAGNKASVPAVATISIGALPVEMASAVATPPASGVCSNIGVMVKTPPTSSTPPTNQLADCKIDANTTAGESTSSASSSCCSPSSSSLASTSANSLQGGGSKSMLKASSEIMAKMTAAGTKTLAATCKSSNILFELDEDYDNI